MNDVLLAWLQSDRGPEARAVALRALTAILLDGQPDLPPETLAQGAESLLLDAAGVLERAGIDPEILTNVRTPEERQERVDPAGTFRRFALENEPSLRGLSAPFRERAISDEVAGDAYSRWLTTATAQRIGAPLGTKALTFEDFLGGGRPSSQQLARNLREISNLFGTTSPSGSVPEVLGQFAGELERQYSAAIQPRLQALSPALQPGYRRFTRDMFDKYTAENPEQAFLPWARQRGFFGTTKPSG
jgi:hypothetical protein